MKRFDKVLQGAICQNNLLDAQDLERYIAQAQEAQKSLKEFLISNEILTSNQVLISLSQYLNIEMISFKTIEVPPEVIERVPVKFAWYYRIMPVRFERNVLFIASSDPLDLKVLDELRVHFGCEIRNLLAEENNLIDAIKKYYGLASQTIDQIMVKEPIKQADGSSDPGQWIEDLEGSSNDATVSNLVNQIILEAYKKRATDIHIEPYRDKVRFRYRIDGVLVDANLPDNVKHFLAPILSRIKILANLSITEKRLPQDGSAVVRTSEQHLDLRVSTMPTPRGESMVIRILPTKVMLFSLEKLGFNQDSIGQFRNLINNPHGIIFLTGPTGSGKTTTLYACLNEINSSERKIITIEDPVEYEMPGITQVQVNPKVNFHFSTGLRSILRHDPDIIMVGEVRDPETAEIAIKTALTGHLVFSTLHTNDAASGITRLIDMGVEPYLVASSVEAFVAQRLVRIICPNCKVEDENPMAGVQQEIAKSLGLASSEEIKIYKGQGCDKCNDTGFYGRMAVYEILKLDDVIRAAILEKPRSDYIKSIAMQEGMKTLRQNAWKAVINGFTTPDEVINVTIKDDYLPQPATSRPKETQKPAKEESKLDDKSAQKKNSKTVAWTSKNDYKDRIYPRIKKPVTLTYQLVTKDPQSKDNFIYSEDTYIAFSEDVSAGGLSFKSSENIDKGSLLGLKVDIQEIQQPIECLARVCRVEKDEIDDQFKIAAYYLDMSSHDRFSLNRYIGNKITDNLTI